MPRATLALVWLLLLAACGPAAQPTLSGATALPATPAPTAGTTSARPAVPLPTTVTVPISALPSPASIPTASVPVEAQHPTQIAVPSCLPGSIALDTVGDRVTDIASGPGRTFAAAYSQVLSRTILYASDDKGLTWTSTRTFNELISSVALSPDFAHDRTVFAAGLAGLYRSTNAGGTWGLITPGTSAWFTTTASIKQVVVSPNYSADHTIILASRLSPRGLFVSTDGGATWIDWLVDTVDSIMFSPNYASDHALWVARNDERTFRRDVLVTVNQGDQWDSVRTGAFVPLAISPAYAQDSTILWTNFAGGGIYVSRNGDRLFPDIEKSEIASLDGPPSSATNDSTTLRDIALSPDFGGDRSAWVLTDQALLASRDAGASWQALCSWPAGTANRRATPMSVLALSTDFTADQTVFAAGGGSRVLVSHDGGRSWTAVALN